MAAIWLCSAACTHAATAPAAAPGHDPFAHWAVVVTAGDWRAAGGAPTDGFDNARRDVVRALERAGFSPANVAQLSVRPTRYPDARLAASSVAHLADDLRQEAAKATDGCLVYLTTHGNRLGTPVGEDLMTPDKAAEVIDGACGQRPTVVIISACFSGVFIPALAGPERMVFTAARPDRTSFGCGQNDKYPYFDDCILKSMPDARDFLELAYATQACVAAREAAEQLIPPSQPQLYVGTQIEPLLKADAFVKAAPAPADAPARRKPGHGRKA